jgi:hypothetical protein
MKRATLGLLAAAGCNQIWGLGPVALEDNGDANPGPLRFRITTQITRTTAQGFVDPTLDYVAVVPAPAVQLGAIGAPLEPAEYGADGSVLYPRELVGKPWRMVWTLADGLPREVQWSPGGDLSGHFTEPMFGRLERLPVPTGGGYTITPIGSPNSHSLTRVFTTGLWTEGTFPATIPTAKVDYDFATKAKSLSGPLGAPEKARTDYAVLTDFKNATSCRVSSGVAEFPVPDLVAGNLSTPATQPTYVGADKQVRLALNGPRPVDFRLKDLLSARGGTSNPLHLEYGFAPSLGVSGFSRPAALPILDFYLPGPQLLAFATCTFPSVPMFNSDPFADPLEIRDRFPSIVHVEATNQRTRGLLSLTSGFSAVLTSSSYSFTSDWAVAAPVAIKLVDGGGAQIADLENLAEEPTPLPPLGPMDLVFDVEAGATLVTDLFEITLYEVKSSGQLERQRLYTVATPRLALDPAVFRPATEYVFEVRAVNGRPKASQGDFATNMYPQYAVAIFTRTFKTP